MNNLTKEVMIEINKGIIHEWIEKNPSKFEGINANQNTLDEILEMVNKQDSIIMKASYVLAGIHGLSLLVVVIKEQRLYVLIQFYE